MRIVCAGTAVIKESAKCIFMLQQCIGCGDAVLYLQVFGTPRGHHRVKPFFDHVLSFTLADGCVWLRNYQVRQHAVSY